MKININGVTRDMTEEEEAEMISNAPQETINISDSERMDEIESAMMELAAMIGGDSNG